MEQRGLEAARAAVTTSKLTFLSAQQSSPLETERCRVEFDTLEFHSVRFFLHPNCSALSVLGLFAQ